MKANSMFFAVSIAAISTSGFAGKVAFDCKLKSANSYTATIANAGTMNRSIQVTFSAMPINSVATRIVKACVKQAISLDSNNDAIGSAWVGESQVKLSNGHFYSYLSQTRTFKFM